MAASGIEELEWIWMNGEFVPWQDAKVHVLSHALHYGTGVFEGIRCYDGEQGPAVFRHQEHLERLERSAELYYMKIPYSVDELAESTRDLIRRNGLRSCYIRPLVFRGYGEMGLYASHSEVDVMIAVWPWGAYLGEEGKKVGIKAKVSSWRRISPLSLIPQAKASGQYLNSILAKTEAADSGYDEAILLDERGMVCEGSGENIFVVRDGEVATPPSVASILDGISRRSVMTIARDLGYEVVVRDIARGELYQADEVFLTGTAAEMVPVRSVDQHDLGEPGEITRSLQERFEDALYGRAAEYSSWLDPVGEPTAPAPPEPRPDQVQAEEIGEPKPRIVESQ